MEVSINRIILSMLVLSLMVACATWACSADQKSEQTAQNSEPNKPEKQTKPKSENAKPAEQAKAIAEIQKLGGKVEIDEKSPDKQVVGNPVRHDCCT
jgi:hypothetical protein